MHDPGRRPLAHQDAQVAGHGRHGLHLGDGRGRGDGRRCAVGSDDVADAQGAQVDHAGDRLGVVTLQCPRGLRVSDQPADRVGILASGGGLLDIDGLGIGITRKVLDSSIRSF